MIEWNLTHYLSRMDINTRFISNKEIMINSILFFFLFVIISIQNISAMLVSNLSKSLTIAVFAAKEVYIVIFLLLLISSLLMRLKIKIDLLVPSLLIIYILFYSLLFSPHFNFVSLRQLIVIPVFMLFGSYFIDRVNIQLIGNWVYKLLIIIVVLAFFERLFLNGNSYDFFKMIGIERWAEIKGWGYGIPGSWYSNDLLLIIGERIRRVPGLLIADPVNFGQLMIFPLMISLIKKRWIYSSLFFIAIVMGLSKGSLIGFIVAYSLLLYKEMMFKSSKYLFLLICIISFVSVFIIVFPFLKEINSIADHYRGFIANIIQLPQNILGAGIGSGGNFGRRFSGLVDMSSLFFGESYFGTMISQLGIIGVLFYFYYPIKLLKINLPVNETFLKAVQYSTLGLFFVGLFSETAFTYIGTGIIISFMPFVLRYSKHNDVKNA
jgi:hypothetical protein